jgi:hypothetical protein
MPRHLPSTREIPWDTLRRRATNAFELLQAGWKELTADERAEIRRLLSKSRGRPRNLTRDETRRLGQIAGRAARAAANAQRKR